MKVLSVFNKLEIVVVFIHCVEGHFIARCYLSTRIISHRYNKIIKQNQNKPMSQTYHKELSLPPKSAAKQYIEEGKKSRKVNSPASSRFDSNQYVLRFDINTLLSLFNEMEVSGTGQLSRKAVKKILDTLGLYNHDNYLKAQVYTFDHFLSIIGEIEVPNEPSVYVLSFVKILVHYRDKCLLNEQQGLQQAKAVQQKIKGISWNQIKRQKSRIRMQHSKIYDEMQRSQYKQIQSFQDQWNTYLKQFREETSKKIQETRYLKKSKLIQQENKYLNKMRRTSIITSPWLRELAQKKKSLISQKKYEEAIEVTNEINKLKLELNQHREQQNQSILQKKLQKLSNQTNRYIGSVEKTLQMNFNRLMSKKKQGESIMKIRMRKLREEANKKLNEHYKNEITRLKSSFYMVANH